MRILFSCRPNCIIVIDTKFVHGTIALKVVAYKDVVAIRLLVKELFQRPPLLRWVDLNSIMDKLLQLLQNVDWIYLTFVKGIPRSTVDSLHEGPVMREALPFNYVIMKLCKCVQASLNIDRRWLHVISQKGIKILRPSEAYISLSTLAFGWRTPLHAWLITVNRLLLLNTGPHAKHLRNTACMSTVQMNIKYVFRISRAFWKFLRSV